MLFRLISVHEAAHDAPITCTASTDDNKLIVTGGEDAVVKV